MRLEGPPARRQVLSLNLNKAEARPVSLLILKLYGAPRFLSSTGMRLAQMLCLCACLSSSHMGRQVLILRLNEAGARPVSLLILKQDGAPGTCTCMAAQMLILCQNEASRPARTFSATLTCIGISGPDAHYPQP